MRELFLYPPVGFTFNGTAAVAAFSDSTNSLFTSLPHSGTNDIVDLTRTSNVNIPGVWMFQVDGMVM